MLLGIMSQSSPHNVYTDWWHGLANSISDTSITDAKARTFLKTAQDRTDLACEKITGFHLCKIGKGASWRYRYRDASGKRRVMTIGNYPTMKADEAAQYAMEWRNRKADPLEEVKRRRSVAHTVAQLSEARTLRAYLDGIYTLHQSRKKNSGIGTINIIRCNFSNLLDRDMTTICAADIKVWQMKREKEGRAYATLYRAYGALRTLLRHAVKEKIIDDNPISGLSLSEPTAEEKSRSLSADSRAHRRMLTPDELAGINKGLVLFAEKIRWQRGNSRKHGRSNLPDLDLVSFPHWFIPFCSLGRHTGMRPGDLYSLTWLELNLRFKRLVKMPEKTLHNRNPAKLDLPLNNDIYNIMLLWNEQNGSTANGLVFPSTKNGKQFDKQAHDRAWGNVLALGCVDPNLHFYSLRHHFISALVASGAPLLAVAKLVGHKSAAMIEKHYGHLAQSTAADLLQSFSETLKPIAEEIGASSNLNSL